MPYPAHPCTPAPDLCTSHMSSSVPSPCDTAPNLRRAFASAVYALPTLPVSVPFLIPQSSRTVSDSRLNKSSACQPSHFLSISPLRQSLLLRICSGHFLASLFLFSSVIFISTPSQVRATLCPCIYLSESDDDVFRISSSDASLHSSSFHVNLPLPLFLH